MKLIRYSALALSAILIEVAQAAPPQDADDPLISRGSDIAIYISIAFLIIGVGFALKSLSPKFESALVFAVVLAAVMIAVLWSL